MALPDERFEICYLLDAATRARILPALRVRLLPCPLAGPGARQRVQSLYLGEPAPVGTEQRRRLRLRLHEAEGKPARCVVEIKHRIGLRSTVRHAAMPLADAQALVAGVPLPFDPAARAVAEEARGLLRTLSLRSSLLVGFERLALVGCDAEEDLRVTLDSDIGFRSKDVRLRPWELPFEGSVLPPGEALLVIKVARAVPHWLTLLLGRSGAAQRSRGKHALAWDASQASMALGAERSPREG